MATMTKARGFSEGIATCQKKAVAPLLKLVAATSHTVPVGVLLSELQPISRRGVSRICLRNVAMQNARLPQHETSSPINRSSGRSLSARSNRMGRDDLAEARQMKKKIVDGASASDQDWPCWNQPFIQHGTAHHVPELVQPGARPNS